MKPSPASHSHEARLVAGLFVLLALLVAGSAAGTVFLRPPDEELVRDAETIVEATVIGIQTAPHPLVAVEYRMRVERWVASGGPRETELTVRVPGGVRPDGTALYLLGAPRFDSGERLLLFLSPHPDGTHRILDLFLGAFRVHTPSGAPPYVARDAGTAIEFEFPGRTAPKDGPRDLEAFVGWIHSRVRGEAAAAEYFLEEKNLPTGTADKFAPIVSSTEPPPLGCGANGGHPVRWFEFDRGEPVSWFSHLRGQPGLPDRGIDTLDVALEAWNEHPETPIQLRFAGVTFSLTGLSSTDGRNTLLFDDPNGFLPGTWDGSGLLALGGPWFQCTTEVSGGVYYHPVIEGDIVTQDGLETFFAAFPDPSPVAEELFAHELGHTLGLAHSEDPEALMFSELHADLRGAALAPDDRAAIAFLYGAGATTSPPAPPEDFFAELAAPDRVLLGWNPGDDQEDGFRIERRRGSEPWQFLTSAPMGIQSATDDTVNSATRYGYRVRAQNRAGFSPWSQEVFLDTPADGPPAAPSNLRAAPLAEDRIRLRWQDNSHNEDEFRLLIYSPSAGSYLEVPAAIPPNVRVVDVTALTADTSYAFRLRARNDFGTSETSESVPVTTFPADAICTPSASTLCLAGGRFEVTAEYQNHYQPGDQSDSAAARHETDVAGSFFFFQPDRLELTAKVFDGRARNGRHWVFLAGTTDLEFQVRITDNHTGTLRTYRKPRGSTCGVIDLQTFLSPEVPFQMPAPPPEALGLHIPPEGRETPSSSTDKLGGSCQPSDSTLCLLDRRLAATLWFTDSLGRQRVGRAMNDEDESGGFWFFDPQLPEVMIKAIDGISQNGHLWLFTGPLTSLEYELTVTDTLTGDQKIYYKPAGGVCGEVDVRAFPSP